MNRYEFIENLRKTLSGQMSSARVAEHIRYYEEYIDMQMKKGMTEQDVLNELGDPRLLAKSIITAEGTAAAAGGSYADGNHSGARQHAGDRNYGGQTGTQDNSAYGQNAADGMHMGWHTRVGKWNIPLWCAAVLIVMAIVLILICIFAVTVLALRILLPVILIVLFIRLIVQLFRKE